MPTATYALSIQGTHYHEYVENVIHFIGDGAAGIETLAEGADLADSWVDNVLDAYLDLLPPTYLFDRVEARVVKPAGNSNVYHRQFINAGHVGTLGTAAAADNLCPSITLIPPMGFKSPGRIYMPCIPKESIDNNTYVALYQTLMGTFMTAMFGPFANSTINWAVAIYSRKNDTSVLAQAYTLSASIGFQSRRRKPV